jgi:hypothetical protein
VGVAVGANQSAVGDDSIHCIGPRFSIVPKSSHGLQAQRPADRCPWPLTPVASSGFRSDGGGRLPPTYIGRPLAPACLAAQPSASQPTRYLACSEASRFASSTSRIGAECPSPLGRTWPGVQRRRPPPPRP